MKLEVLGENYNSVVSEPDKGGPLIALHTYGVYTSAAGIDIFGAGVVRGDKAYSADASPASTRYRLRRKGKKKI